MIIKMIMKKMMTTRMRGSTMTLSGTRGRSTRGRSTRGSICTRTVRSTEPVRRSMGQRDLQVGSNNTTHKYKEE